MTNLHPLERRALRQSIRNCHNCELREGIVTPVPFAGPTPARVCIVGEAPGREENARLEPFVGPSGQLLKQMLTIEGLQVPSLTFINAVCCWPKMVTTEVKERKGKNAYAPATPRRKHVEACRGNLYAQLRAVNPAFILCVGNVAVSAIHPNPEPIGKMRGRWWRLDPPAVAGTTAWCLATYHPAALLRGGGKYQSALRMDIQAVARMTAGVEVPTLANTCVRCDMPARRWVHDVAYCGTCKPPMQKTWEQGRIV